MAKRDQILPVIPCIHETDLTVWRYCKGTSLKECVVCYTLEEVK